MAADPDVVAKAFTDHYYNVFDTNRSALSTLYQDSALLTFEGQKVQGTAAIVAKLTSLPFQQVQHRISSLDAHPSASGGILIFVTGQILTPGESNPLKFSQVFHLAAVGSSFTITNDLFRLNYGAACIISFVKARFIDVDQKKYGYETEFICVQHVVATITRQGA